MAEASKDNNNVSTILATSNADGSTPLKVQADPNTHVLQCECSDTGSDLSGDNAARDNNKITTILAVSSDDGETPVPVYIDAATNKILLTST